MHIDTEYPFMGKIENLLKTEYFPYVEFFNRGMTANGPFSYSVEKHGI